MCSQRANYGGCSVVVNAPVCGTGDRGFKSHLPPHIFYTGLQPSGKALDFDSNMRQFESSQPNQKIKNLPRMPPANFTVTTFALAAADSTDVREPSAAFVSVAGTRPMTIATARIAERILLQVLVIAFILRSPSLCASLPNLSGKGA